MPTNIEFFATENLTLSVPPGLSYIESTDTEGAHPPTDASQWNNLVEVGVTDYNIGCHLVTAPTAHCHAVIVRFATGEFGLYYREDPYVNYSFKGSEENTTFENLKKACKDRKIEEVIVLETIPAEGEKKAWVKNEYATTALLAVGMAEYLVEKGDSGKVKRLQVERFQTLYCDAAHGRVILCQTMAVKQGGEGNQIVAVLADDTTKLTPELRGEIAFKARAQKVGYLIPYTQSLSELRKIQGEDKFTQYLDSEQLERLNGKKEQVYALFLKLSIGLPRKSPMEKLISTKKTKVEKCPSEAALDKILGALPDEMSQTQVGGLFFNGKPVREACVNGVVQLRKSLNLNKPEATESSELKMEM